VIVILVPPIVAGYAPGHRDSVWLTQRHMAELLETSTDDFGLHLRNVYSQGELDEAPTTERSSVVRREGNRSVCRSFKHDNVEAFRAAGAHG
jgi:hypothetical protein